MLHITNMPQYNCYISPAVAQSIVLSADRWKFDENIYTPGTRVSLGGRNQTLVPKRLKTSWAEQGHTQDQLLILNATLTVSFKFDSN